MDQPARVHLPRREGRQGRGRRVGDRAHEPQSPSVVWLDAQYGEGGRRYQRDRRRGTQRRTVDDQRRHRASRRQKDPLMSVKVLALVALAGLTLSAAQQAPPAGAPQGRGRSPYQEAGQLPARIMEFKAEPASIKPGESTTLTWAVENPRTTTIEPAVGRATPRGVMKVTPKATTTYTLTVTGVNGTLTKTVTVHVACTTAVATTTSVSLNDRPAARTAH